VNGRRLTLTVKEVAQALGLSPDSVYEGVRKGEIPALRVGRRICVPRDAFEKWLSGSDGEKKERMESH
jgi:excisionase family DNA binding protein